jgi:hypothetical protein
VLGGEAVRGDYRRDQLRDADDPGRRGNEYEAQGASQTEAALMRTVRLTRETLICWKRGVVPIQTAITNGNTHTNHDADLNRSVIGKKEAFVSGRVTRCLQERTNSSSR